jgi:septin family protein
MMTYKEQVFVCGLSNSGKSSLINSLNRQPYIFIEFFREIDSERSLSTAEIEICDQRPLLRVYRKKLDVREISENQMSDEEIREFNSKFHIDSQPI